MAVLTPAVYQALAARGLGPRLKPHVEPASLVPWRLQVGRLVTGQDLGAALRPAPVRGFVAEGGTGVPLFEEDELHVFLSDAEGVSHEERRGRWWEFWPTEEGSYAMFPGDDDSRTSVPVTLWIPMGRTTHVRRLDLAPMVGIGDRQALDRPVVPPEGCTLLVKEDESGAPYRGRCENVGCDGGCTPHVVVQPDDGIYRLTGCTC